jgi:uncharacterized protein YdbL (DUF1318 family)
MKLLRWLSSSVAGLMLVSCVTINIYFPAAAAEKAADRIIEDVWGTEGNVPAPADVKKDDTVGERHDGVNPPLAMTILNWIVSPALAEPNINISSSAINSLRASMRSRHTHLKAYYDSGAVGLTENGLISIRDAKAISLKDRNTVSSLVADENKDRNALYKEIASENGHPEWRSDIQSTFAERWIQNAPSGWWYQSGGSWKQH